MFCFVEHTDRRFSLRFFIFGFFDNQTAHDLSGLLETPPFSGNVVVPGKALMQLRVAVSGLVQDLFWRSGISDLADLVRHLLGVCMEQTPQAAFP
jgi:hypothetical protein